MKMKKKRSKSRYQFEVVVD